jgi:hypothetical protein
MFFDQPKKWPQLLIGAAILLFVFKNPEAAAHAIQSAGDALSRFVDAF